MPRNRTVRVAVLGSSVQRAAASGSSSTRSGALRRRIVVGFLVLLSLGLITVSFRSTALDPVQSFGASVLRPFELAANRVARPFEDGFGWAQGLVDAKSEKERLAQENEELQRQVAEAELALQQLEQLQKQVDYRSSPRFPDDYVSVAASVMVNPSSFERSITISAGSKDGIREQDVVVTNGFLVGLVTKVFPTVARVTLITDPNSAVSAVVADNGAAVGIVEHGSTPDSLVLSGVTKDKKVDEGDRIVTAGSPADDRLPSLFPQNILIGTVSSVGQNTTDIHKQIQVQPYVNFGSLHSVLVLVPKTRSLP